MKRQILTALAVLAAAGCADETSDPVASELGRAFLPCALGTGVQLAVGEALTLRGEEASVLCVQAGGEGGEYTLVPFFATSNGLARLRVEAVGGNLRDVTGPPDPSKSPAGAEPERDQELHMSLVERMRTGVSPLLRRATTPAARLSAARASAPAAQIAAAVPDVGSTISINIPRFYLDANVPICGAAYVTRQARVAAVTQRAILVNDPTNPAGGLSDAELRAFGDEFDRQIYPVDVQHFGAPTDLDQNGRVIIVFTREVNALTPRGSTGYVGGYFFGGDLFPRVATPSLGACERSNVGEIFYLLAPDPAGTINGNPRSKALVLQTAPGTIAHEFEHLINSSRRIYVNDADNFEESWLDEALAHSAEELNFYASTGLAPRQNLDLTRLNGLQGNSAVENAFYKYMIDNMGRYLTYLQAPDSNSVIGEDLLETRGGSWAFLRYAADRRGEGDQPFFFKLVNSRTTGLANLRQVILDSPLDWAQDWTLSVYTDDAVPGVEPRFTQPSWNFRSIMPEVAELYDEPRRFPLLVHPLVSAGSQGYNIRGGGATYFRFGIGASSRVALRLTQDSDVPPASLRFSLVRTR
ncbi:MAG TPA: hypothetical protein VF613_20145 [Longimicrobium sp.]|jgi:hypothetical protein